VKADELGYHVVTPLHSEGIAYIRWVYDDFAIFSYDKCDCGRTHLRMYIVGRAGDEVVVRGKSFFPGPVTDMLYDIPEIGVSASQSQLIKTAPKEQDKLILRTLYSPEKVVDFATFKAREEKQLSKKAGVPVELEAMTPEELQKATLAGWKMVKIVKRY
jgi:phenylacetate-CoA ligase